MKKSRYKSTRTRRYSRKQLDRKYRIRRIVALFILIILFVGLVYILIPNSITIKVNITEEQESRIREIVRDEINKANMGAIKELTGEALVEQITEEVQEDLGEDLSSRGGYEREPVVEVQEDEEEQTENQDSTVLTGYRMTSYWENDDCNSTATTGSGKKVSDFDTINIGGAEAYTYQGKLVFACATHELLRTGYNVRGSQNDQDKYYFRYYETFTVIIDGEEYEGICLDSCGASMWEGYYRIDLFTNGKGIDRSNVTIIL